MNTPPNRFGAVLFDRPRGELFGSTVFDLNGSSMTVTTFDGGVVIVMYGGNLTTTKPTPKAAP